MSRLTIVEGWSTLLTANQRLHHMERARRTRILRVSGKAAVQAFGIKPMTRAHITVTVSWPDGRRRDVHNVMPTVKAHVDGFVDAGLIPDDDDKHLIGPDLRVSDERASSGTVRLRYEFVEVA